MSALTPPRPRSLATRRRSWAKRVGLLVAVIAVAAVIFAISAFFWTWVLMLVLGAVGYPQWGYWETFPLGVLTTLVLGALRPATSNS